MNKDILKIKKFIVLIEDDFNRILSDLLYCKAIEYINMYDKSLNCFKMDLKSFNVLVDEGYIKDNKLSKSPCLLFINNNKIIFKTSNFQYMPIDVVI